MCITQNAKGIPGSMARQSKDDNNELGVVQMVLLSDFLRGCSDRWGTTWKDRWLGTSQLVLFQVM